MKLTRLFIAISAVAYASAASSGTPDIPTITVNPLAVAASSGRDWSGFYLGGLYGSSTGGHDYFSTGSVTPNVTFGVEGSSYGGFVGYNIQRNNLVYGAEISALSTDVQFDDGSFLDYSFDYFADLKGRVGYAFGDALIFGSAGASLAHWIGPFEEATVTGFNYGIGVDYAFSEHMFVGLEYTVRDMSSELDGSSTVTLESDIQTIQLRFGYSF